MVRGRSTGGGQSGSADITLRRYVEREAEILRVVTILLACPTVALHMFLCVFALFFFGCNISSRYSPSAGRIFRTDSAKSSFALYAGGDLLDLVNSDPRTGS